MYEQNFYNEINTNEFNENSTNGAPVPVYNVIPVEPEKKKKHSRFIKPVALALSFSLLGSVIGCGISGVFSDKKSSETTVLQGNRTTSTVNVSTIDTENEMTAAEVYAMNVNSTVGIKTSVSSTNFWGYTTSSAAAGSGFILTADGYIITNFHVVEDADDITVTLYNGTEYSANLIGYDEDNDIAVLKVDAENLTPVVLGDSSLTVTGEDVIAIGNPLGELTFSLTKGVISALDREVTLSGGTTMKLFQTDCAINSGNSGGALFNMYGEVIGITNAKYSSSSSSEASIDNIGFAIPVNSVSDIINDIIEKGYISKTYMGITVEDVSEKYVAFGIPAGALVASVDEQSPASSAGIKANDIITAVNGTDISGSEALEEAVNSSEAGDILTLTVYRSGETLELSVTLTEKEQSALPEEEETENTIQGYSQQMPGDFSGMFGMR